MTSRYTVRAAKAALRAKHPEHADNVSAVHANLASYEGDEQALMEFMRLIIAEPDLWRSRLPKRWGARRAKKARSSYLYLADLEEVSVAIASEGRAEVIDELKAVFDDEITEEAIATWYGKGGVGTGTTPADDEPGWEAGPPPPPVAVERYPRLREMCLELCKQCGRDDMSSVLEALWSANVERADEASVLRKLMRRIWSRQVTWDDVDELMWG